MLSAYVDGIGLLGPGLSDWTRGAPILAGQADHIALPTVLPLPAALPAAERRRSVSTVKLALTIGFDAAAMADLEPTMLSSVFASSGADGQTLHEICEAVSTVERKLSPTRFANVVHNAASGYWSIAAGAITPTNAICAFDASFAAGLLEALIQVKTEGTPVLLLAYDVGYPPPLRAKRPIPDAFAVAFALVPHRRERSLARLSLSWSDEPVDELAEPHLEELRRSIPAARSLTVLRHLARREPGRAVIEYLHPRRFAVEISDFH